MSDRHCISPLGAKDERLQGSDLRSLGRFIDEHGVEGRPFQPLENLAPSAAQCCEHHLRLLHKGQLQVVLHLQRIIYPLLQA